MLHFPLNYIEKSPLDEFFNNFFRESRVQRERKFSPLANIVEKADKYLIHIEVPGVKKEAISIEVKNNSLTVKGKRESLDSDNQKFFTHIEIPSGTFARSWTLEDVETEGVEAAFHDGILELTLPKKKEVIEKNVVKKIAVK